MLFAWSFIKSTVRMLVVVALVAAPLCLAQKEQAPVADNGASGMTLHVTVRELQVAALVLDMHRKAVTDIDRSRFRLRLDNGKTFLPMTVHRAGDDPFSLAVVMDLSQTHRYQTQLAEALAAARRDLLLPHDRLLLFAADCNLISYRGDTSTPEGVKAGVEQIQANPSLHSAGNKSRTCADSMHLWDTSMLVLRKLSTAPGRHAVLLITDGRDNGSVTPMLDLARMSTITATTLFALPSTDMQSPNGAKSPLEILVTRTGGRILDAPSKNLEKSLADCVELLRERYILGFNQPQNAKPGDHMIQAMVQRSGYVILTSGVSAPLSESSGATSTIGQDASTDGPAKP